MVGWHPRLDGYDFEQTPGDGEGQGSLACCSPRGCKGADPTDGLNNNKIYADTSLSLQRHKMSDI